MLFSRRRQSLMGRKKNPQWYLLQNSSLKLSHSLSHSGAVGRQNVRVDAMIPRSYVNSHMIVKLSHPLSHSGGVRVAARSLLQEGAPKDLVVQVAASLKIVGASNCLC